jgi:dienelactone hydrolase
LHFMIKKWLLRIVLGIGILMIVSLAGGLLWLGTPVGPMPEVQAALQSDDQVEVLDGNWLVFRPKGVNPDTGLIFYQGSRVATRSYAPAAHAIAAQGYLVVIPQLPMNQAVFAPDTASEVIDRYPTVTHWAIGGHSLGGAMAARYTFEHQDTIQGLVLWAAYPASSDDLSLSAIHVASISGTLDGLATPEKIAASRPILPSTTQWVVIDGGNHAQFGWYGDQPGDNPATISREAQQTQTIEATVALLESLKDDSL